MKWTADPSCYRMAVAAPTDKVYHTPHQILSTGSILVLPRDRLRDRRGLEASRVGAVAYRGRDVRKAHKTVKSKGIVQGGARPPKGNTAGET